MRVKRDGEEDAGRGRKLGLNGEKEREEGRGSVGEDEREGE